MSHDLNPPQSFSAYVKSYYFEWIMIPKVTSSGNFTLKPLAKNATNNAYRINSPFSTDEHFIIEYRNKAASGTDANISGSGLLVYRVNTAVQQNASLNGNLAGPPDELYIYR